MYNKNLFKKTNEKKVLHKIGKHWAVVSVALLAMISGGYAATQVGNNTEVDANAASTTPAANHTLRNNYNVDFTYNGQTVGSASAEAGNSAGNYKVTSVPSDFYVTNSVAHASNETGHQLNSNDSLSYNAGDFNYSVSSDANPSIKSSNINASLMWSGYDIGNVHVNTTGSYSLYTESGWAFHHDGQRSDVMSLSDGEQISMDVSNLSVSNAFDQSATSASESVVFEIPDQGEGRTNYPVFGSKVELGKYNYATGTFNSYNADGTTKMSMHSASSTFSNDNVDASEAVYVKFDNLGGTTSSNGVVSAYSPNGENDSNKGVTVSLEDNGSYVANVTSTMDTEGGIKGGAESTIATISLAPGWHFTGDTPTVTNGAPDPGFGFVNGADGYKDKLIIGRYDGTGNDTMWTGSGTVPSPYVPSAGSITAQVFYESAGASSHSLSNDVGTVFSLSAGTPKGVNEDLSGTTYSLSSAAGAVGQYSMVDLYLNSGWFVDPNSAVADHYSVINSSEVRYLPDAATSETVHVEPSPSYAESANVVNGSSSDSAVVPSVSTSLTFTLNGKPVGSMAISNAGSYGITLPNDWVFAEGASANSSSANFTDINVNSSVAVNYVGGGFSLSYVPAPAPAAPKAPKTKIGPKVPPVGPKVPSITGTTGTPSTTGKTRNITLPNGQVITVHSNNNGNQPTTPTGKITDANAPQTNNNQPSNQPAANPVNNQPANNNNNNGQGQPVNGFYLNGNPVNANAAQPSKKVTPKVNPRMKKNNRHPAKPVTRKHQKRTNNAAMFVKPSGQSLTIYKTPKFHTPGSVTLNQPKHVQILGFTRNRRALRVGYKAFKGFVDPNDVAKVVNKKGKTLVKATKKLARGENNANANAIYVTPVSRKGVVIDPASDFNAKASKGAPRAKFGSRIRVVGAKNNALKVVFKGNVGYVHANHVTKLGKAMKGSKSAKATDFVTPNNGHVILDSDAHFSAGHQIAHIKADAKLPVLGRKGNAIEVSYKGHKGYVHASHVSAVDHASRHTKATKRGGSKGVTKRARRSSARQSVRANRRVAVRVGRKSAYVKRGTKLAVKSARKAGKKSIRVNFGHGAHVVMTAKQFHRNFTVLGK